MEKNNLLLMLFMICISFISCDKDEESSIENDSDLIGTWELISRKEIGGEAYVLDRCEKTSTIDFRSDNTYIEKTFVEISSECVSDGEFSGSWSVSESILTLMYDYFQEPTVDKPKFKIEDDILIITFEEIEDQYQKK